MKKIIKFLIIIIISLVPLHTVGSQSFPKNKVIQSVPCKQLQNQSYALFLPENYTSEKKWPVIFIFDPLARGTLGISKFLNAGKKFGYILVCSNNSRNYNENIIIESVNAVWNDVPSRFCVDPERIYTAGMSGGARLSTRIADKTGQVAGVIACAAGFSSDCSPDSDDNYVFACIIGRKDYNHREMDKLFNLLEKTTMPFHLIRTDGNHDWPNDTLISDAVEWLEYNAMKSKKLTPDLDFINTYYTKQKAEVQNCIDNTQLLNAVEKLSMLIRDFARKEDEKLLKSLQQNPLYIKQFKEEEDCRQEETSLLEAFSKRIQYIDYTHYKSEQDRINRQWVKKQIDFLTKDLNKTENQERKNMLERVLLSGKTYCHEMMQVRMVEKNFDKALLYCQMYKIFNPKSPNFTYNEACLYSHMNKKKKALKLLKKSIALGFNNINVLETDSDLDGIRDTEEFQKILNSLKNSE